MKIKMIFVKVQTIKIWSESKSFKDILIFMKFVNFYRRFINKFSRIVAFFIDMLKRLKKRKFFENFEITSATKKAFRSLKSVFFVASVLLHFDSRPKIRVETNASKIKIFDIINQLIESIDQWHFIAFFFKKKNAVEMNYETEKSKMLIVVKTCKQWKHYFESVVYQI